MAQTTTTTPVRDSAALPLPDQFAERGGVEVLIYIVLAESDDALTPTEIASVLKRSVITIRRRACDLADEGLLERHRDPRDGRRNRYSLSEDLSGN